jgi:hypothetical protein
VLCIKFGAFVSVALSVGNSVVRTTVPNLDFMSLKIFLLLILGAVSNRIFTSDILKLKYVKIACLDAVVAALIETSHSKMLLTDHWMENSSPL